MRGISVSNLTKVAIVAALYIVLTIAIAPIGYGAIQFRVSEILNLLVFFNPIYGISLIIGCALSNIYSPLGIYDVIFGTLSTALSVYFIAKSKNLFVASLWPSLFIPVIVALELYLLQNIPFVATAASIFVSEFIIMTIIAYPIFKGISKNEKLMSYIEK
ncbi:MAG: QueT transporter family protein [Clostridium sp.]|uniref:QueT transporter family protein n=1 Tax=Clostridium sp. TaxID=1506 RepID=UPI002FC74010